MKYVGQEKVKLNDGPFKDVCGYVRLVQPHGFLWVVLDNGRKTNVHKDEVTFIRENYFIDKIKIAEFLENEQKRDR